VSLTVAQLREHVTTSLVDAALARLLDAAYESIDHRIGPAGTVTESLRASGPLLMLSHRADSVVTVTESAESGNPLTLDSTDYRLRPSSSLLERLTTGTNPRARWRGRVDVTYSRAADQARRDEAAIALVRLDMDSHPGLASQSLGDWTESYATRAEDADYAAAREAILVGLEDGVGVY
jgi:hypothetical protein